MAARGDGALYLRGTGTDAYLLALHAGGPVPQIRAVTLRARSAAALRRGRAAAVQPPAAASSRRSRRCDDPAGGTGLTLRDPDGRLFQVVHGDARRADAAP